MKIFRKAEPDRFGFFMLGFLSLALLMSGCQRSSHDLGAPNREAKRPFSNVPSLTKKPSRSDGPTRSFLGLSKSAAQAKAEQLGLGSRVVREDSERFILTRDLRKNRINFEIDKGLVTSAKIF